MIQLSAIDEGVQNFKASDHKKVQSAQKAKNDRQQGKESKLPDKEFEESF